MSTISDAIALSTISNQAAVVANFLAGRAPGPLTESEQTFLRLEMEKARASAITENILTDATFLEALANAMAPYLPTI